MNGFDKLLDMANRRSCDKGVSDSLERGKNYLKTRYPIHCADPYSEVHSHSTSFALSDKSNPRLYDNLSDIENKVCADCLDLFKSIQLVIDAVKDGDDEDMLHDTTIAVTSILNYIKHLIRDAQQKKAKSYCFLNMDQETCFWLKDFSQKIIPVKYKEGQKDYFGKKGMSMHVDVFFVKRDNDISKQVFITVIYWCDQGIASSLCISEHVLKEFKKSNPVITKIFTKSDNASSYHGNFIFEALHKVCKGENFQLLRTDYNEPSKGKDQCDRESAAARNIINSFVNAGNDLTTAEDVYTALHYGNGLSNAKVSVLQINGSKTLLSGKIIKNVSSYHSIQYFAEHMKLWRYFDIGNGVNQLYSGTTFVSDYQIILP